MPGTPASARGWAVRSWAAPLVAGVSLLRGAAPANSKAAEGLASRETHALASCDVNASRAAKREGTRSSMFRPRVGG